MISLNFAPFPEMETNRLLLRVLNPDDTATMFYLRSNEQVTAHFNRAPDATIGDTMAKIEEILQLQEKNEAILWVITLKEAPAEMIGNIGFWRIDKAHHRAEIGYLLHPAYWKKGIMKEALLKVTEYAFKTMKLHSIEANINPGNVASAALLGSCNFIKEAFFKENYYYNGVYYDTETYSKLDK